MARVVVEGPCYHGPDGPCGFANVRIVPRVPRKGRSSQEFTGAATGCRYAFIDRSGRIVSDERFDRAKKFSEGLAPVKQDDQWQFIDKSGNLTIVLDGEVSDVEPFSDGLAKITVLSHERTRLYGYVDRQGQRIIAHKYVRATDFRDGLAAVSDGTSFFYINQDGERAFPQRYERASHFFGGLAHVKLLTQEDSAHRFAYIDSNGKEIFAYSP